MQVNEGSGDRIVRGAVAVGAFVASAAVGFTTGWGILLLVVMALMAGTAMSGFCPVYRLVGMNTCPRRTTEA